MLPGPGPKTPRIDTCGHFTSWWLPADFRFGRPVAVLLSAIPRHLRDEEDPAGIAASLRDAISPGSYLLVGRTWLGALSHSS